MGIYPVDPAVRNVLEDAVSTLEHAGATVDAVDPDLGRQRGDPRGLLHDGDRAVGIAAREPRGRGVRSARRGSRPPSAVSRRPSLDAEEPTTREYKRADVVRTHVLDGLVDLFEEYDLLVTATAGTTPFPTARNRRRSTASRSSRIGAGCSRSRSTSPANLRPRSRPASSTGSPSGCRSRAHAMLTTT